ncbi:Serine/threonine-protein kinase/endoribonuclease IRE2 [Folsomia candida]|uniref:Serine/threonine-protein kinase/endoribonuclease IRE2 n=1 Tax=Folsomia candida TaxID=158441 RepID=A0A226D7P2_FOLCA|nr:Serine/threonine-protein kinase/endoribonuclease IRE2 [Folsomia candida]
MERKVKKRQVNLTINVVPDYSRAGDSIVYYPNNVLGNGATSIVYGGFHEVQDRKAAVKRIPKNHYKIFENELEVWRKLTTPDLVNIVGYYARYEDTKNCAYFIAMELALGTLDDVVTGKPNVSAWTKESCIKYLNDASQGLEFLHGKNIIHRDIKPSNIMIFANNDHNDLAKLGDFGISRIIELNSDQTDSVGKGTYDWMAPEVLQDYNQVNDDKLPIKFPNTTAIDIFCLGQTYFYGISQGEKLFGNIVFRAHNVLSGNPGDLKKMMKKMSDNDIPLIKLVLEMVKREPTERPTIQTVLKHPFHWDNFKFLEFVQDVAGILDNKVKELQTLEDLDKAYSKYHLQETGSEFDFEQEMSSNFVALLSASWKKNYSNDSKSCIKLIELIRDKLAHFSSQKEEVNEDCYFGENGKFCKGKYAEYFNQKFPLLGIFLHDFFKRNHLERFYLERFY